MEERNLRYEGMRDDSIDSGQGFVGLRGAVKVLLQRAR